MACFAAMPGAEDLASELAGLTEGFSALIAVRRFPDGESHVRVPPIALNEDLFMVARIHNPDEHFVPLIFAARALRGVTTRRLGLVIPYLPYMRQDAVFQPGEALSSEIFADLLGREFDQVITVEPHLHRHAALSEIFHVPTKVVSAARLIGDWVRANIPNPLIVGPDAESEQWARAVALIADAPWVTLLKDRSGDREVRIQAPDLDQWKSRQPVLVDDIISSGATIIAAARELTASGFPKPWAAVVHGLIDHDCALSLQEVTQGLVTTDTITGPFSRLRIAPAIAELFIAEASQLTRSGSASRRR